MPQCNFKIRLTGAEMATAHCLADADHDGPHRVSSSSIAFILGEGVHVVPTLLWVACSERLPKPYTTVFFYVPGEAPRETIYQGFRVDNGNWYVGDHMGYTAASVTHWLDLADIPTPEAR